MLRLTVAAICVAQSVGFAPLLRPTRGLATTSLAASYLSAIEDDDEERRRAEERDAELLGMPMKSDKNHAPQNMDLFVDFGDEFDGGDGQTGVVGDGTNNMENFDYSEVTQNSGAAGNRNVMMAKDLKLSAQERLERSKLVADSKSTQVLSFGATGTGYAEQLKERGLEKVDRFGEDKMHVRRQQFENWHQQQGLRSAQRQRIDDMDAMETGDVGNSNRKKAVGGYFAELSGERATTEKSDDDPFSNLMTSRGGTTISSFKKAGPEVPSSAEVVPGPPLFTTEHAVSKGSIKIVVENPTMTFQDFTCAFTADSHPSYKVTPVSGTLEGRNKKAPTEITVIYKPEDADIHRACLVIKTKARTWTHILTTA